MFKSLCAFTLAVLTLSEAAFAFDGCGPKQICTYKGRLKAGEACPASFCQGSSYYEGAAAAASGGVLKVVKRKAAVAEEAEEKGEGAKTVWQDPPAKSTWKEPPPRAPKAAAKNVAVPAFTAVELKAAACRKGGKAFADLSAECKQILNVEAMGLNDGPASFCHAAFAGDEAGFARCMEGKSDPEIDYGTIYRQVLSRGTGSLEKICRRANGSDEEGFQRCVETRAVVNSRGGAHKGNAPAAASEEAPVTSMSVE